MQKSDNQVLNRGGLRASNIELCRCLLMIMIVVGHLNFISIGRPDIHEINTNFASSIVRIFIQTLVEIGVDGFILISGWFGIKASKKGFLNLIFQFLFYFGAVYVLLILLGFAKLTFLGIADAIDISRYDWFVKAYICLYILSPLLNAYTKQASIKVQRNVLLAFFCYMFIYGWIGGANRFFVSGYTPLSFIGLYLLANYARDVHDKNRLDGILFTLPKYADLLIYLFISALCTFGCLLAFRLGIKAHIYGIMHAYSSPFIVIGALYFFLFFTKLEIKSSRIINTLAASSFAVYLFHSQRDIRILFTDSVQYIYSNTHGIICICMLFLFVLAVYLITFLIDQLRKYIWNIIKSKI